MLVLGLHAECAHVGFCGVDRWAVPELGHALCRPRSRSEGMLVNEISARLNLEHVDTAAELQVLYALCPCTLDLFLALWRPHVQVLDGPERCIFWGSHDHAWSALSDLLERFLTALMFAEIQDVAI